MPTRVRVDGTDRVFDGKAGDDLLEVFQSNGEPIATSCGGVASCGLCRVTIVSGGEHLVPIKPQELVHLGNVAKVIGLRLACQAQLRDDVEGEPREVVVRIPPVDDVEERKRRKAERSRLEKRATRPGEGAARASSTIEWRPQRLAAAPAAPARPATPPEDGAERKKGT